MRSVANKIFQVFVPLQFGEETRGDDLVVGTPNRIATVHAEHFKTVMHLAIASYEYAYRADGSRLKMHSTG